MGWIKEIDELNDTKKAFIISLPILSCFWFMCIVLFANCFYMKNEVYVSMILSFCFSFSWYLINFLNMILGLDILSKQAEMITKINTDIKDDTNKNIDDSFNTNNITVSIFLISFIILSISIIIQYFCLKLKFSNFLGFSFGLLLVFLVYQIIRYIITTIKYRKSVKKQEESTL